MKQLKHFFLIALTIFACNEEPKPFNDLADESKILAEMSAESAKNLFGSLSNYVVDETSYDLKSSTATTLTFLNRNYLQNSIADVTPFVENLQPIDLSQGSLWNARTTSSSFEIPIPEHFTDRQANFITEFTTELFNTTSPEDAIGVSNYYRTRLIGLQLPHDQALELLNVIESTSAVATILSDSQVINEIAHQFGVPTGRVASEGGDCDETDIDTDSDNEPENNNSTGECEDAGLNWQSVWQSAVLTGMGGFATGVYVGATGGTVIIPGIGTVAGAVSVGMVGLAGGFISGAGYEIARQLIFE